MEIYIIPIATSWKGKVPKDFARFLSEYKTRQRRNVSTYRERMIEGGYPEL